MKKIVLSLGLCFVLSACQTPIAPSPVPTKRTDISAYNPKEYGQAYAYFSPKANHGDLIAEDNLAHMYEDGRGVPEDPQKAVYWYTKAAKSGNADAAVNLGVLYLYGKGVAQSKTQACHWFAQARSLHNKDGENFYRTYC